MSQTAPPRGFIRAMPGATEIDASDLDDALEVAFRACDRARAEILPRFRRVAAEIKRDGSPVTEADREAELAMRAVLQEAFPSDAILGEEFGATATPSRRRWVIDPIDGTIAYSRGIPLFTTLIALLVDEDPVLGVIDLPAVDDRIHGIRGGGAWRGSTRIAVSRGTALEEAMICHGDLRYLAIAGLRPLYDALSTRVPTLRGYTDAFGHLLVLSGAAEAMIDCDLNPWDAAPTRILAQEAGGLCWVRERDAGRKLDLIFGNESCVHAIGRLIDDIDAPQTHQSD